MKIIIDQEACIGCGSCSAICPDLFELGDDTKARAKKEQVEEEAEIKCAKESKEICPVEAIELEE